jgi:hypothetical protein
MTMWKFQFDIADEVVLYMPQGAEVKHVATPPEGRSIFLWALVDPEAAKDEARKFYIRGTGHPVPDGLKHVGTAVAAGTGLVWHMFEP